MNTPPLKVRLYKRQGGLCWLCLKPMAWGGGRPDSATIDHVVPLKHSGANKPDNKLLAHDLCNKVRGHRPFRHVRRQVLIARALARIDQAIDALRREVFASSAAGAR